jgi:molecular chaperone GrpE (heat shock protein)
MSLLTLPKAVKWPFLGGDLLLLGLCGFLYAQAKQPLNGPTLAACVACVVVGAVLAVVPFLLDYRATVRLVESNNLANTVDQIRRLEDIGGAVEQATGKWQAAHQHASEAVQAARQVSEKMSDEMKSFVEFLEKANDSERQHLRLEVDKLKRAESDWLGVLVRILDHVFAIHAAARRADQPKVLDQLSQFQSACRDAARRVGLSPFEPTPGTPFDPQRHHLPTGGNARAGARVAETLAIGFTFRGQMIRPAMVALEEASSPAVDFTSASDFGGDLSDGPGAP